MKKIIINTFLFCLGSIIAVKAQTQSLKFKNNFFIENKGQWPKEVLYKTQTNGLCAWITTNGVVYDFFKYEAVPTVSGKTNKKQKHLGKGHIVCVENIQANANVSVLSLNKLSGYYNYFIGNNSSKWVTNVSLYNSVITKNVYNGIDQHWYYDNNVIRYDYIVNPGADYKQIAMQIKGANNYYIKNGELYFTTCFGEVKQAGLTVYEEVDGTKKQLVSQWQINQGIVQFNINNHNEHNKLIIDPLIYATYLGGNSWDIASSIITDGAGNAIISGESTSSNFPTTVGVYQADTTGGNDVFITKLNSSGNALIYSTFIGGSGDDYSASLKADSIGNIYFTGHTNSSDFPSTNGVIQTSNANSTRVDAIIAKLNNNGTALLYSTYLGGTDNDYGYAIAVDKAGNAFIAGETGSNDFPVTTGAFQTTIHATGGGEAFIVKINPTATNKIYATLIGGGGDDNAFAIAIDSLGNAYITGNTSSTNFPVTAGAFQHTFTTVGGGFDLDAFVTKLNSTGTALVYSTFLGGNNDNYGTAIAVDALGYAYVTGYTDATNFPTTSGAYQRTYGGGTYVGDMFVTKLNKTGTAAVYSTYLGGSIDDVANAIAIDATGNAYIAGRTSSGDYPVTADALQNTYMGGTFGDVVITKLNNIGTALLFSTYYSGSNSDEAEAIAVDENDTIYVAGYTQSSNLGCTLGVYQDSLKGSQNAFVLKIGTASITGIKEQNSSINQASIKFYPNPCTNVLQIETQEQTDVVIFDALGQQIFNGNLTKGNTQIDVSNFADGVYFVKTFSKNNSTIVKLIKTH